MIRHKKERTLIRELFSPDDGPFKRMNFNFKFFTIEQLDIAFSTSFADMAIAPLLTYYAKNIGTEWEPVFDFSEDSKQKVSDLVLAYYKYKWQKLIDIMETDYDPIHNFQDNLHEDIDDTGNKNTSSNNKSTQTGTGDRARTDDLTSTETKNLSTNVKGTDEDQMQGFNSTSYQNKDKSLDDHTTLETGTDTTVNTGTQKTVETRNFTNTNDGTEKTDDTYKRVRDVLRTGNIGNITTQSMITQEIELWRWNFMKEVLNDTKIILTLPLYPS